MLIIPIISFRHFIYIHCFCAHMPKDRPSKRRFMYKMNNVFYQQVNVLKATAVFEQFYNNDIVN